MRRFTFNRTLTLRVVTLLFLLAPLAGMGVAVWVKHQQLQASLSDLEPRYARLLGLVNKRAELESLRTTVNAALTHLTYPATQDLANAGNDAQQRVRSLFADSHLDIISVQVLPAKEEGQFNHITINLRVEGNLTAMHAALDKLPTLTPTVLLDSMALQTIGAVRPASVQRLGGQFNFSVFRVRS